MLLLHAQQHARGRRLVRSCSHGRIVRGCSHGCTAKTGKLAAHRSPHATSRGTFLCYGCNPFRPGAHLRCAPQHAPEALVKRRGGRAGQALFILIGCKGRRLLVCKTGGGGAWQHRSTSGIQGQAPRTGSKDRRAWSSWAAKRGRLLVCKNAGIEGAYQASSQAGANSTASFLPTHSNQADGTPSLRAGTHQQPHTSQQRAEHGQRQGPCWTRCHALRLHHSQTLSGTSPHLHPVAHLPAVD